MRQYIPWQVGPSRAAEAASQNQAACVYDSSSGSKTISWRQFWTKYDCQRRLKMEDTIHERWHDVRCHAVGTGDTGIEVEYLHNDGGIRSVWKVDLQVGD